MGTSYSRTTTSSQSEIFSSYNNQADFSTYTPSQSEISSNYDVNSESSSRETSRTIITSLVTLQQGHCTLPSLKWQ